MKKSFLSSMIIILGIVFASTSGPAYAAAAYDSNTFISDTEMVASEPSSDVYSIPADTESDIPIYSDDLGIYTPPQDEADPELTFTDESSTANRFSDTTDASIFDSIDADATDPGSTANITRYPIKIDASVTTNRNPSQRFSASTPEVITFSYMNRYIAVAYPTSKSVKVLTYSNSGTLVDSYMFPLTLPIFGSIISDDDGYFYIFTGQSDTGDKNITTVSLTKYSPDQKVVASLDLNGYDTIPYSGSEWGTKHPFWFGNCCLAINNGVIAANYAREMYNGHQSNMIIFAYCNDLTRIYADPAYTSHSFDQRIYPSGSGFIALNHGDAYNRGFHITKMSEFSDVFKYRNEKDDDFYTFHFREGANRDFGYNETFAQLGGLAEMPGGYVFAASSERTLSLAPTSSSMYLGHNEARDLFIQLIKKDASGYLSTPADRYLIPGETRIPTGEKDPSAKTETWLNGTETDYGVIWLTNYDKSHYAANPKVFAISDTAFGLLWEERSYSGSDVSTWFSIIKMDGTILRAPRKVPGCRLAADTDPIVLDGYIYWATKDSAGSYLQVLSPSDISVTRQPDLSNYSANNDGSYTLNLSITASGVSSYEWQESTDLTTWNSTITGLISDSSTASSLSVRSSVSNISYRCVMTDDLGYSVISHPVAGVLSEPEHIYAELGNTVDLSVNTLGISSFVWEKSANGKKWEPLDNDSSPSLTISLASEEEFGMQYRCVMTSLTGDKFTSSPTEIRRKLIIKDHTPYMIAEKGTKATASLTALGDALRYAWYHAEGSDGPWTKITGSGNTVTIESNDKTIDTCYKCVVTDKYGNTKETEPIFLSERDSVSLKNHKLTLVSKPGQTRTLPVIITGNIYKESDILWASSDSATIQVNAGTITVAEGLEEPKVVDINITTTDGAFTDSCCITVNPMPIAAMPAANVSSGKISQGWPLILQSATPDADIHYTLDGTAPSAASARYVDPIPVTGDMTIRAISVKKDYKNSPEIVLDLTVPVDWGDITGEKLRSCFDTINSVPDGIWYIFGNEQTGYTPVYRQGAITSYVAAFTGNNIIISSDIQVFNSTSQLWENRDYTVSYKNNKAKAAASSQPTSPTVVIKGKGYYSGTESFTFTIDGDDPAPPLPTAIKTSKVKIGGLNTKIEYTGQPFTIATLFKADKTGYDKVTLYTVVNKLNTPLIEGVDYDVHADNNGSIGKHVIYFRLKGDYTGTISKTITITPYNITRDAVITCDYPVYEKAGTIPTVTVTVGDLTLSEGVDYTVSYKNNASVTGTHLVTVTGKGNYTGKATQSFMIAKAPLSNLSLLVDDVTAPVKKLPVPKVTDEGYVVAVGRNKDIEAMDKSGLKYYFADTGEQIEPDTEIPDNSLIEVRATITAVSSNSYEAGSAEIHGYFRIFNKNQSIKKAKVTVKPLSYRNRLEVIPLKSSELVVSINGTTLAPDDYEIVSITKNIFPGTATLRIKGKGIYSGIRSVSFKIIPLQL